MKRLILVAMVAACVTGSAAGQKVCAGCHRGVWESYQKTGMGRSFHRPTPEDFTNDNTYYHKPSESYFTMLHRNGTYFQRRYQLDSAGKPTNVMEKQVDYIMGSGNHARTYLSRTSADTLMELPLGWYAEKGGYFAMNPGYDRPNHDGFRRPITYDCMFCHNAYPKIPADSEQPVYSGALPEGIDCQRCHGPGARHVQLAGTAGSKRDAIRNAIVNPARLTPERQLEGCMVCHLETTSFPLPNAIQRFERPAFSYQPGEPLANFIVNFDHAPGTGREDKFEIVNAAYRLRRSQCFLKSAGKLVCTTCHNPHIPAAKQDYTAACRQCHAQSEHARTNTGCAACHMPKRRTEDVIHVAATDHYIQRQRPSGDLLAEREEHQDSYRGRVALYYPTTLPATAENDLTLAVAQVIQESNLKEGIPQLTAAIERYKPKRAEYYLQLAEALQSNHELAKALPMYREAVARNPKSALTVQKLGTALRRSSQYAESVKTLQQAISLAPTVALTWHELGQTYRAQGKPEEAASAFRKALTLDPDLPEAHNNLGILTASESEFREAIRIKPDYADAHGNLANLLSQRGNFADAQEHFAIALRLRAEDAPTHYNYAMLLGRTNRLAEAQRELESALRIDPKFADAHELLGNLLLAKKQSKEAIPHFREALKTNPESPRSHLGLGAALAMMGDVNGAVPHLQKAAADAATRDQAMEILRQLRK